jgi:hypothetical protein
MDAVRSSTAPEPFRVFKTDKGAHTPETLADMTLYQLASPKDDPAKVDRLRRELVDAHSAIQQMIRTLFEMSAANDGARRRIIEIIARDFATSLDIERQHAQLR